MDTKISVIMPTFNSEDFVQRAISSVIKQSFKDWELIIIDDGSSDNTLKIVNSYTAKDGRIKLVKSLKNGAGAARNLGIDSSKADLIAFIDSDDYYDVNFLANAYQLIQDGNDCVVFDYYVFHDDKGGNVRKAGTTFYNSYTACWNKVYKKELWQNMRFDEDNSIEDLQVVPIVVGKAQKVVHSDDKVLYYYSRDNDNSITHVEDINESRKIISAIDLLIKRMKENHLSFDNNSASFINNLIIPHLVRGIQTARTRKDKKKLFSLITRYLEEINKNEFGITTTFYNVNKFKRVRTNIVISLMSIGLYYTSFKFMELSWYIGGRIHK